MDRPTAPASASPWRWVPSLYFAQGLPYVAVMSVAVAMYKNLGVSNTAIGFYTSWLYLPWVIKPLWSPFVDLRGTKRRWVLALQYATAIAFALVALTIPASDFFRYSLAALLLLAFNSATHDIAADGFYLLALPGHERAAFAGVRNTFYRAATIAGQGGIVFLAGWWQERTGDVRQAWWLMFLLLGGVFVTLAVYHTFALPRPTADQPAGKAALVAGWLRVLGEFFRKPGIVASLAFVLLYRLGESQLVKLVQPFLLDARAAGGLGLTTKQVGIVYGTIGVLALLLGGLLGGYVVSRHGLKRLLWPMLLVMHAPNLGFVLLAALQPDHLGVIGAVVAVEQFGYGFGFTAFMVYLMLLAEGPHQTAHYALGTGFMALGMMVPGMAAGWIEDHVGYVMFFVLVCLATLPSFVAAAAVRIDPAYGRKH